MEHSSVGWSMHKMLNQLLKILDQQGNRLYANGHRFLQESVQLVLVNACPICDAVDIEKS